MPFLISLCYVARMGCASLETNTVVFITICTKYLEIQELSHGHNDSIFTTNTEVYKKWTVRKGKTGYN